MSADRTATARSFSTPEVVERTGLSYRQLDHWVRTRRITPSVVADQGSGSRRRWSESDVEFVLAVGARLAFGLTLDAAFDPTVVELPKLPERAA